MVSVSRNILADYFEDGQNITNVLQGKIFGTKSRWWSKCRYLLYGWAVSVGTTDGFLS